MGNDRLNAEENALERRVSDYEKTIIINALARTKGNRTTAAKLLGTTKRVLTYKVRKYEIDCKQFKRELNVEEN
jgi:Nif-specific regulatory protein